MSRGGAPLPLGEVRALARRIAGNVDGRSWGEVQIFRCSACGVVPVGPRPDVCRGCVQTEAEIERDTRLAERLLIPPRFRWARLELAPFAPPGMAGACAHPEAVRRVRAFRGRLLVLHGESRRGKSSLASARLLADGLAGMSGVYVRCGEISGDAPEGPAENLYRRARWSHTVVLDDLGKELAGAPKDSPLAAFRGARTVRLLRELHDEIGEGTADRLLIVTIGSGEKAKDDVAKWHGEDIAARLFEPKQPGVEILNLDGLRGLR